ncbi:unnamed protein product (macronuclear) [Paramecium tetraurelia]|uniref:Cilia- and flagella-associated protein 157 n=1 Tax=Paramecium tetraurelia TaxID=5888 RepID=A0BGB0_PARTE|nr:uncharacterized protein GSPATT00028612001 [Paramecium tetraurelia]CAK57577.1 unnamed protein product [Paramecium tetraurelia]|eukprot:XP_001424975.1 hypothetical protein (macronuclear) [Paramecium tetraurelia strain d4-2]
MDHINKDNLHDLNKKLTEENQRLSLLVYGLQRQLQNAAVQINYVQSIEQKLELLQFEIIQLKKDNQLLQEQAFVHFEQQMQRDQLQLELDSMKSQYEQKLQFLIKENKRLGRLNKEIQNKQTSSIEASASKLIELSNDLKIKLENFNSQSNNLNQTVVGPKGMTKKIYDNLIQQLQTTEEKSFQITHAKRFPMIQVKEVKQQQKSMVSIPIVSSISSIK